MVNSLGWGGYIANQSGWETYVTNILDEMNNGGYTNFRYWARPYWLYGSSVKNWSNAIGDAIINGCTARGMRCFLDAEHNYPPSEYVTSSNKTSWKNDLLTIGLRYTSYPNVILEIWNEQTGTSQVSLANECIAYLRANGVHNPLLINFWWNQSNVALTDSDNNYGIGRHFYPPSYYETATRNYPISLDTICGEVVPGGTKTIDQVMYTYFDDPSQSLYWQRVNSLGIPLGWMVTELGPFYSNDTSQPPIYGLAYMMRFLQRAREKGMEVACYRIGNVSGESRKTQYENWAWTYFGQSLAPVQIVGIRDVTANASLLSQGTIDASASASLLSQSVIDVSANANLDVEPPTCSWGTATDAEWAIFRHMGDVNGDGVINSLDLGLINGKWGWTGIPGEIPEDLNSDGKVNSLDWTICTINQGKTICSMFSTVVSANASLVSLGLIDVSGAASLLVQGILDVNANAEVTELDTDVAPFFAQLLKQLEKIPSSGRLTIDDKVAVIDGEEHRIDFAVEEFQKIRKGLKKA